MGMLNKNKVKKLIREDGKQYGMKEIQVCPHCKKMIHPKIISDFFQCDYCHICGGRVKY